MDTQEQIEYWLRLTEYDLETAKAMQQTGRYLYVGFMCQQVIEKALKAGVAKIGEFPPKTHDLPRLARLGGLIELMDEEKNNLSKNSILSMLKPDTLLTKKMLRAA